MRRFHGLDQSPARAPGARGGAGGGAGGGSAGLPAPPRRRSPASRPTAPSAPCARATSSCPHCCLRSRGNAETRRGDAFGAAPWSHFPTPAVSACPRSLFSASTGGGAFGFLLEGACRPGSSAGADPPGPRAAARKCARPALAARCVRAVCTATWAMGRRARSRRLQQQQQRQRPEGAADGTAGGGGKGNGAVRAGTKAGGGPAWPLLPEAWGGRGAVPRTLGRCPFSFLRAGKAGTPRS